MASSRHEDADISGFLLRNSSFKYGKFPFKRKISLKADGKQFQENLLFFFPENKINHSRKGLSSPEKLNIETRFKAIRNSDMTSKRNQGQELRQYSRSLNCSGIHNMNKKNAVNYGEFNLKEYSQSKDNHQLMSIKPFKATEVKGVSVNVHIKNNRPSIDQHENRLNDYIFKPNEDIMGKQDMDLQIQEKRNSLAFSDVADFEFSCVELNESKDNHVDTESVKNILDHSKAMQDVDSVIMYSNDSALHNHSQSQLKTDYNLNTKFKKINGKRDKIPFMSEGEDTRTHQEFVMTTESWIRSDPENMKIISEALQFPRKISDIPVINSTKRGSLIMFGGEFTPVHKRSEVEESHFDRKDQNKLELLVKNLETPKVEGAKEKASQKKQNITDLMKMIIQKTENLSTVEETNPMANETSMNSEGNENSGILEETDNEEIKITDLGKKGSEKHEVKLESENDSLNKGMSSEQFESSMTNMPSIVNIESSAHLETIFDINFDPSDLIVKTKPGLSGMHPPNERRGQDLMQGSMLTDEYVSGKKEIFKVVSNTDNDWDSIDQGDSILLMSNKEINKKRTTRDWVDVTNKHSGSELDSHVVLQSVISNWEDDAGTSWINKPKLPPSLIDSSRINFLKKPPDLIVSKQKFQEVIIPGSSSLKQKFRNSKLAVKIARMSKKTRKTEAFNMRSPVALSITNHTDISDPRHYSPKSQLKRSLQTSKQKGLKEKFWESLISSKKGFSVDTNSRLDQTLGSVSIQSLSKKPKDNSMNSIKEKEGTRKGNRTVRKSNNEEPLKYNKPRYLRGYFKQIQTGDVNQLRDKIGMNSLVGSNGMGETSSTSRFLKNSQHENNLIYTKVSQQDMMNSRKELRRSNTLQHETQDQDAVDFNSVKFEVEGTQETKLISNDKSQREINANILRQRNKKEIESKFQNIYKHKPSKMGLKKQPRSQVSGRNMNSQEGKNACKKEKVESSKMILKCKPKISDQQSRPFSGRLDSQSKNSETNSLCYGNKNSVNDSSFLPFPRSVKNREDKMNQSKKSGIGDKNRLGIKDYFSGNNIQLNLGQREEYEILSGRIIGKRVVLNARNQIGEFI